MEKENKTVEEPDGIYIEMPYWLRTIITAALLTLCIGAAIVYWYLLTRPPIEQVPPWIGG